MDDLPISLPSPISYPSLNFLVNTGSQNHDSWRIGINPSLDSDSEVEGGRDDELSAAIKIYSRRRPPRPRLRPSSLSASVPHIPFHSREVKEYDARSLVQSAQPTEGT